MTYACCSGRIKSKTIITRAHKAAECVGAVAILA